MGKITVEEGLMIFQRYIFGKALRLTYGNFHDAQDLVSETTIRALSNKNSWNNYIASFHGWISGVMFNAIKQYRYGTNRKELSFSYEDVDMASDESEYELVDMNEIISKLPYPDVAILNGMGYTNYEIGDKLNRSRVVVIKWAKRNREAYHELTST